MIDRFGEAGDCRDYLNTMYCIPNSITVERTIEFGDFAIAVNETAIDILSFWQVIIIGHLRRIAPGQLN